MTPAAAAGGQPEVRHPEVKRCAVVPVRDGVLPSGAIEAVAEAHGDVVLIGSGVADAAPGLTGIAHNVILCEAGDYSVGAWAKFLGHVVANFDLVILPASPDGRDLAPRLAAVLGRDLVASTILVGADTIETIAHGGRAIQVHPVMVDARLVVTFQPGTRRVETDPDMDDPTIVELHYGPGLGVAGSEPRSQQAPTADVRVERVLPPDVSTMDLSEAPRLLGGGAGLDSAERFEQLSDVAGSLDAAMGATRVITDRAWLGHDRQIGTTGVVVDPELYIAFGISGAVQHTAGLGNPEHIISVNTDEHCPMMEMADLAIVSDANATLDALQGLISERLEP